MQTPIPDSTRAVFLYLRAHVRIIHRRRLSFDADVTDIVLSVAHLQTNLKWHNTKAQSQWLSIIAHWQMVK